MKKLILPLVIIGSIFQSCDRKSCENVVCSGNNQTCIDGVCVCMQGYEGANCDELTANKLQGSYQVSENCTTTFSGFVNQFFSSSITPTSYIEVVTLNNFSNRGLPIDVTIVDATYFVITEQDRPPLQVSGGEGYKQVNTQIRFEYNYTISGNFHSCTAIYTKF